MKDRDALHSLMTPALIHLIPAVLVVILAGCSSTPGGTSDSQTPAPPIHASYDANGFTMVGDESASRFSRPDAVPFRWVVTNVGADATRAEPPSCRPERNPEITLLDSGGRNIPWRSSGSPGCMIATQNTPFPSGSSFTQNWTWDGTIYDDEAPRQAPPGRYSGIATFEATGAGASVSVGVRLDVDLLD